MARIEVIPFEQATGQLKDIYDELIDKRGKLADVHTIQSLRPQSIVKHIDLYMEIMFSRSDLSRAEREMIAVVVSAANKCYYCQMHHSEALNRYWKNSERCAQLRSDFRTANLTKKEMALCEYAEVVTLDPGSSAKTDYTKLLKNTDLSDSAVLDATLVVSYFNFVNRIVLSLNVELETDSGTGYKY